MRILLDARYLDGAFTGIGTYSREMIEHLSMVDHDNYYYVLVRAGFEGELEVGKNFEMLTYAHAPVSFATIFQLGNFVDSLDVDLMHSFFPVAPLRMKTPLIVTMHDLQPFLDPDFSARRPIVMQTLYNLFYHYIYPATMAKAKWVVNVSYYTRDAAADLFPEFAPKLIVATSGLDEELLTPPTGDFEAAKKTYHLDKPFLLYYGSTRPNKNLPMIVRAFARYVRDQNDTETELVLILKKDRFFRDVTRAIRLEGIAQRVRVLDQVPAEDQRVIIANARVFLFATKHEGFGFPALEAMAAGTPVIAGSSGALPEICGDAAEFVNPDDRNAIARAIGLLMTDEPRRKELIEKGRKRAAQFDWRETAERMKDIYRLLF
ncbi:glycosyltransferase family 1 protein [soil metagenome]